MTMILKVLVGSHAHGLARPDSDVDHRGVFVHPTSALLSLGPKPKETAWHEADKAAGEKDDSTAWELGHFLHLATHCNPTILEVFAAPVVEQTEEGRRLRSLFPHVWNPKGVRDAFVGYGLNQRKKFLEDKDARPMKYACAYLRVLYQAEVLLRTSYLPVDMTHAPVYDTLLRWRGVAAVTPAIKGEVVATCLRWQQDVDFALTLCAQEGPNLPAVNAYLLDVRRSRWDG